MKHDVHDLLALCVRLRAHQVRQVAKDDEFNDEGDEDPEWAVELRCVTLVLVDHQLVCSLVLLLQIATKEGKRVTILVERIVHSTVDIMTGEEPSVARLAFLISDTLVHFFAKYTSTEKLVVIDKLIGLVVRMEWPQGILEIVRDLRRVRVEVDLVLVRVEDVPLEQGFLFLARYGLISQVTTFQSLLNLVL